MTRHRSFAALLCAAALAACGGNGVQDIAGAAPGSAVKFFNFAVGAPGVNFYANDSKITAISSTSGKESFLGTTYGNAGNGGYYNGIAPGQYTLKAELADSVNKGTVIANAPATLADGKYYSYYTSGTYDATGKASDGFLIADDFPATIDYSTAYVRLVNAISNAQPMILYAKNDSSGTEAAVGDVVAYKAGGAFVKVPNGTYDLSARYAGSATNLVTRASVSFVGGRVYTVGARGDITVTSSKAAAFPAFDVTPNR